MRACLLFTNSLGARLPALGRSGCSRPSRLWITILLAASVLPSAAQKRPFSFEDMMALKRVEEPEVSPDGKWVLFAAVDVDLAANTKTPHVWIVPTAGGEEREIIAGQDADRPRWAPDGKRFAFLSTKEGGSQVWIADFDGATGTANDTFRFTSIATEASGELWSPDGTNVLFASDVYPECDGTPAEEQDCNRKKMKEAEHSKVKAQIFTHLLYRHWNAYKEGKRTHIFVMSTDWLQSVSIQKGSPSTPGAEVRSGIPRSIPRDLTPGEYDAPVFSLGGQDDYAFSTDGKEICYASNHDKNPAASTNNDLWIVPVTGGEAKNITADNPASDSTPLYSPDGRYIAYRAQKRPGYESDRFRLMLYDRKTGAKRDLSGEYTNDWVGTFVWSPDSSNIFWELEHQVGRDNGHMNVVVSTDFEPKAVDNTELLKKLPENKRKGLRPLKITQRGESWVRGYTDDLAFSPDGKTLLFTRMSLERPNEIWRLVLPEKTDPDNPPIGEPLTHLNDAVLSQIEMPPLETFWFKGANDDDVQGFLVKPPNFDVSKKYPVKFLIHGGPEGAWGDDWSYRWNPELFASPTSGSSTSKPSSGYVVIMINFHGSTGYGQKFIDAINGDWGGAPFEDLMKGLDYAEQTYPFIDKNRECALGASYGGYMINWILGHTDRFKCLVSHDGMFNAESAWGSTEELWFNEWEFKGTPYTNRELYRQWSPHLSATNFKTPTLVIHSQLDYRLDVSQGFDLFTTLQRLGVPSKMLYFPDEGHWVLKPQNSQLWYKTVDDWVDQWVGSSVPSRQ